MRSKTMLILYMITKKHNKTQMRAINLFLQTNRMAMSLPILITNFNLNRMIKQHLIKNKKVNLHQNMMTITNKIKIIKPILVLHKTNNNQQIQIQNFALIKWRLRLALFRVVSITAATTVKRRWPTDTRLTLKLF